MDIDIYNTGEINIFVFGVNKVNFIWDKGHLNYYK